MSAVARRRPVAPPPIPLAEALKRMVADGAHWRRLKLLGPWPEVLGPAPETMASGDHHYMVDRATARRALRKLAEMAEPRP